MSQTPEQSSNTAIDATWLNWLPIIAGLLALILISSYIFTFQKLSINENPAAWGAFGDYIGGLLNPLISLFTLIVAMKVWNLQKIELIETRKAVEEQGKTAEQQRQEQRFFDLLNIYHRTVDSITHVTMWQRAEVVHFRGKEALATRFDALIRELAFEGEYKNYLRGDILPPETNLTPLREILKIRWRGNENSMHLDSYFRVIFRTLAELEALLGNQHYRYAKLLRAQLNRNELTLLGLNMWLDEEGIKMIPLAEKYGLLKHLQPGKLRDYLEKELPPRVFGRVNSNNLQNLVVSEQRPC